MTLVSPTFGSSWHFQEKCRMYSRRDSSGFCYQFFKSQGLPGRTYVPWKLLVKISLKSSQLPIMFHGRWSSRPYPESAR
jgi:hypothetical protein